MACEKHVGIRFSYCFHIPILKMTPWYEMNSYLKAKASRRGSGVVLPGGWAGARSLGFLIEYFACNVSLRKRQSFRVDEHSCFFKLLLLVLKLGYDVEFILDLNLDGKNVQTMSQIHFCDIYESTPVRLLRYFRWYNRKAATFVGCFTQRFLIIPRLQLSLMCVYRKGIKHNQSKNIKGLMRNTAAEISDKVFPFPHPPICRRNSTLENQIKECIKFYVKISRHQPAIGSKYVRWE